MLYHTCFRPPVLTTSQSYRLWDAQRDWELEILETAPKSEKHAFRLALWTKLLIVNGQANTGGAHTGLAP